MLMSVLMLCGWCVGGRDRGMCLVCVWCEGVCGRGVRSDTLRRPQCFTFQTSPCVPAPRYMNKREQKAEDCHWSLP